VILNLVMNARDAMPEGGQVRISTSACTLSARAAQRHPGLQPGEYATLTVTDTGCGMDEQVRKRLFEPFFTTKRVGEGVGLGMSMVYGIVSQSGGAVSVSSKPGKGTRVAIHLPCSTADSAAAAAGGDTGEAFTGGETILLAEDDPAVRSSVAHMLTETGYRVLQARDGEQAVRLARAHADNIHLFISDVVMPGMCGCDAVGQVQQLHPETQALYITGYPAKVSAAAADAMLLYKPFSRAMLAEKVREILDHRPSSAVASGTGSQQEREVP
jgi:CheY-like chemotaxis protein